MKILLSMALVNHRHMPEINFYSSLFADQNLEIAFTPHLIPTFRGMLSTIYVKSTKSIAEIYDFR